MNLVNVVYNLQNVQEDTMGPTVNTSAVKTVNIKRNVTVKLANVLMDVSPDGETLHVVKVRHVASCIN